MTNIKLVFKILGLLIVVEAILLLVPAGIDLIYKEDSYMPFLTSSLITLVAGTVFLLFGRSAVNVMNRRDGFFIVAMTWVLFTVFGMLPFYISGYIPSITDCFFETMSGFTTTGFTVIDNLESFPHSLLFWRNFTQWIGGLGMVFFTIAVLPIFGAGGIQLFAAEATGITNDKVHPRIGVTARWIWLIYSGITIAETVLLCFAGMDVFDSICHSFSTTATGGFSTKQANVMYYDSAAIEYIISAFMFISGTNFTIIYLAAFKGRFSRLFKNTELRYYIVIFLYFVLAIAGILYFQSGMGLEEAFRKSLFQVATCQTTSGFASDDFTLWPGTTNILLLAVMLVGACAGSTSGGIKCIRIAVGAKALKNEFNSMIHPNAVLPVKVNGKVLPQKIVLSAVVFIIVYLIIALIGTFLLYSTDIGLIESLSMSVSSLGNVGVAMGDYGPAYTCSSLTDFAKWCSSILMLVGRLELFTVLLLFAPSFWKNA